MPRPLHQRGPKAWFLARRVRRFERRVGAPVLGGNAVTVLPGGSAAFDAILERIRAASRGIGIEMYTWADDRLGRRMADAVRERALSGVPVFAVLDAFGSWGSERLAADLAEAGVHVHWYHPLAPWTPTWYPNRRNHRKLVLVDGSVAFTGGLNFAEDYSEEFRGTQAWRDCMLRIEGPSVREMARMFVAQWLRAGGSFPSLDALMTLPKKAGDSSVQVVGGRGLKGRRSLRRSYQSLMSTARERIFLANAYFAPEVWLRRELERAARRGVQVRLLLPGRSDVPFVGWAGRASYRRLLNAGVQIRELDRTVLHAKVAVVDDEVLLAGSANLDYRSFRHNVELAVNVFDPVSAAAAIGVFEDDYRTARPIERQSWEQRPFKSRIAETLAWTLRYWL